MKPLLPLLLAACLAGCMSTKTQQKETDRLTAHAAEAKLAEKLPLAVQPESITKENCVVKAHELEEELQRDYKRMAAARTSSDAVK